MELYDDFGTQQITVEAFDAANASLGIATATPASTDTPVFLGLISGTAIAHVTITGANDSGELLGNLRFGNATAPIDLIFQNGFDLASPPVPPTVAKDFIPVGIDTGTNSQLVITLGNVNATSATLSADLVDTFPQDLVIANPSDVATTCTSGSVTGVAGTGSVTLAAGAQIPANGSCEVTVSVTSAIAGTYSNTIPAAPCKPISATARRCDERPYGHRSRHMQFRADLAGFRYVTDNSAFPYTILLEPAHRTNFGTPFCDEAGCGGGGVERRFRIDGGLFWHRSAVRARTRKTTTTSQDVVIPARTAAFPQLLAVDRRDWRRHDEPRCFGRQHDCRVDSRARRRRSRLHAAKRRRQQLCRRKFAARLSSPTRRRGLHGARRTTRSMM